MGASAGVTRRNRRRRVRVGSGALDTAYPPGPSKPQNDFNARIRLALALDPNVPFRPNGVDRAFVSPVHGRVVNAASAVKALRNRNPRQSLVLGNRADLTQL